ncbi:MAG: mercury methylation ferredoxin HgcB [Desulfurivibrionaceae bacterium]|nr:mercury methylation ferredoxin HgcB [Desulfobulbales bacterium]MDT8334305.1 mercury methylation ferredoxin HgcB [Desulfurivibrionaceae bacterium]
MEGFRYISGVVTLALDREICIGCGNCQTVCPHRVFEVADRKARLIDLDGCMECGACANNCPVAAISVTPGVGCASYVIKKWWMEIRGKEGPITCC